MHEYKYKTYRKIYKKVAHEAEITYYKVLFDLRKEFNQRTVGKLK